MPDKVQQKFTSISHLQLLWSSGDSRGRAADSISSNGARYEYNSSLGRSVWAWHVDRVLDPAHTGAAPQFAKREPGGGEVRKAPPKLPAQVHEMGSWASVHTELQLFFAVADAALRS